MMIKHFKKHMVYYTILAVILAFGVYFILLTSYSRALQIMVAEVTTFIYICLGLIHHYRDHNITTKIVLEYVLSGALGMSIFLLLLQ